jgi:hypothetical protein
LCFISTNQLIGAISILSELFELIKLGHVKPIAPISVFSITDIRAGFRVLRSGKHIGKLIVSEGTPDKIEVPVSYLQPTVHDVLI